MGRIKGQEKRPLTEEQVRKLKHYSDTPISWRDALLMCLLINERLSPRVINDLNTSAVDLEKRGLWLSPGQWLQLSDETFRVICRMYDNTELRGYLVPGSESNGELQHQKQVALYNRVRHLGIEKLSIDDLTPSMCLAFQDPLPLPLRIRVPPRDDPPQKGNERASPVPEPRSQKRVILLNCTLYSSDSYRFITALARTLGICTDEAAAVLYSLWENQAQVEASEQHSEQVQTRLFALEQAVPLFERVPVIVYTRATHPALVTILDRELFRLLSRSAILLEIKENEGALIVTSISHHLTPVPSQSSAGET